MSAYVNKRLLTLASVLLVALGLMCVPVDASAEEAPAPSSPDLLYGHGLVVAANCPSQDVTAATKPLRDVLGAIGDTRNVVGLSYYCNDKGGTFFMGPGFTQKNCGVRATTQTSIIDIARCFAWWVYETYNLQGKPVDLIDHSMFGLIARYALANSGVDPTFPPSMSINHVVSLSSPFQGIDKGAGGLSPELTVDLTCGAYKQCQEMKRGSGFITALNQRPVPASVYFATIGGSTGDKITFAASTFADADMRIDYFASKFDHNAYMTDSSLAADLMWRYNGALFTGGWHPLRLAVWLTGV